VTRSCSTFRSLMLEVPATNGVAAQMNQTTESFVRIEAIFSEALAAPSEERNALIEARSNGDQELAAEVASLLKACEVEESLTASRQLAPKAGRETGAESKAIGPYVLDRLLGRGGMGAVYLAHRADGQFEQQVAIKLIDLPLATGLFRDRFRQERQILAGLQHPFIARLLDGGVTASGDLYLAMEYVDGVPIHRFCAEKHLTEAQRLTLFLRVCEAVEFAHQNLVVHRDLKPDNILVADDGTPRLLDFGTAKLLSPTLAVPGSELTREGYQSFTPQYASPEQVLGNPITTASDTYSLGVLLYLILTGAMPYDLKEFTTAEMLRAICEESPRRPSQATGADDRLDADLEAILLKALRKEPRERYLTAEQLASDIRAYLGGQPVAARQGTLRYRTCKFARRNRLALAGAAFLAVTLVAGVAGVAWQARVADAERRKAEARSADLRLLSNSLLSELDEAIKQLPGSTGVQKLLVTRVLEHLDRMAQDAQGDRLTRLDLVDAYVRLGNIQGNPYDQNLGDPDGGLSSLDKAIALAEPLAPDGSSDQKALRALAIAQESRSEILFGTARTQEAIVSMQASVKTYDRSIETPGVSANLICDVASAYGTLGDELGQTGTASLADTAAALKAFRKSIALDDRALGIDPNFVRAKRGLSINQMKIGNVEMETDPALALKDFQTAMERADALPKAEQENLSTLRMRAMLMRKKANALVQLGEYSKATELFTQVARIHQYFVAADSQDLRALADLEVILNDEALGFETAAEPALAAAGGDRRLSLATDEQLLIRTAEIIDKMLKQDPSNENWRTVQADAQVRLATVQSLLHTSGARQELAKAGIATLKDLAMKSQASPMTLNQAANALLKVEPAFLRDPEFAVLCAERSVALSRRQTPSLLLTLAQAYRAAGQIDKSRTAASEGLALLPPSQPGSVRPRLRKLLEIEAKSAFR
jgi:tetratricopeptide (TPR) repeat protein